MAYTPASAEHIQKLVYTTGKVERKWKLLHVNVTHPGFSNTSPDLDLHVKQFSYEQLDMPNREVYDRMYVTIHQSPNTVIITLSHPNLKIFFVPRVSDQESAGVQ